MTNDMSLELGGGVGAPISGREYERIKSLTDKFDIRLYYYGNGPSGQLGVEESRVEEFYKPKKEDFPNTATIKEETVSINLAHYMESGKSLIVKFKDSPGIVTLFPHSLVKILITPK